MARLTAKRVLLGVTGGIAAYKTPALVRELKKLGADVRVVMTQNATEFVRPLTLQVVSGATVGTDLFDPAYEAQIGHIELARWADVVLLAPATANSIAKLAHGLADDLLSTVLLATRAPLVVSPAMNTAMYLHPVVQENLKRIAELLSAVVVPADEGELACLEEGPGRMPDPEVLVDALLYAMSPKPLAGKRVLVTLGPTRERIDAARYLTNASSGRMGLAMCAAARHLGAKVVGVAGPVERETVPAIRIVRAQTAAEMDEAVRAELDAGVDIAVFTAAVADHRPTEPATDKLPKSGIPAALPMERTPDILAAATARADRPYCVGFAAETGDLERKTMQKCGRKGCDLMVGNDVTAGAGFGASANTVVVTDAETVLARFGPASKEEIAAQIWSLVAEVHESRK